MSSEIFDVIVIGSGPAGLTASIYLTRGAMSTLVVAGSAWGGQLMITSEVDNFPGFPDGVDGPELMLKMRKQAERFGATFLQNDVEKVDLSKSPFEIEANGLVYRSRAIVIATGAATIWLDAPGVKERIGKGISSCAPCDAPFFKDKKVAVVGGGDSAMEEALVISKYASEVVIIHRRDKFKASEAMQERVFKNTKIKVLWNTEVKEVRGGGKVESLVLFDNIKNVSTEVPMEGLFIAIGHKPLSELFKGQIDIDERGFIKIVNKHTMTSKSGVFVAGDVADPYYKQAITAAGYGCAAALDTLNYLDETKG